MYTVQNLINPLVGLTLDNKKTIALTIVVNNLEMHPCVNQCCYTWLAGHAKLLWKPIFSKY